MCHAHFRPRTRSRPEAALQLLLAAQVMLLAGCGGGGSPNRPPVAQAATLSVSEDVEGSLTLAGTDPEGSPLQFRVVTQPSSGQVRLDSNSGVARYVPSRDFFGTDSFSYVAVDHKRKVSAPAVVTIEVTPVNDAPVITAPAKAVNSAYSHATEVVVSIADVDSANLDATLKVDDPDVVSASLDRPAGIIRFEPLARGVSGITLTVTDGEHQTSAVIEFEVTDVTKSVTLSMEHPHDEAVVITNGLDRTIEFQLEHEGFRSFASLADVVEAVSRMPSAYPAEDFPSKLWRFVRDSVAHDYPLTEALWLYRPLVTINSLGWGFCSNVAAVYVRIAREAGYEARVWGLGGHVVPEIKVDGAWRMYDPDLAVFYLDSSRKVASIEKLEQDPSLITSPIDPIIDPDANSGPYNDYVASIYGTGDSNAVDPRYDGPSAVLDGTVRLPPGAKLTYPGTWDGPPVGYDGGATHKVVTYRHAVIDLPDGWIGQLQVPWLIRSVQGSGTVHVLGRDYAIGSDELKRLLEMPMDIAATIEVKKSSGPVRIVMYVNAVRFVNDSSTSVAITGLDVWAADVVSMLLPIENRVPAEAPKSANKPVSRMEKTGGF